MSKEKINPFGFQPPFDVNHKGQRRRWTLKAFFKVPGVYIIKKGGVIVYIGMSQSNVAKACYNHFCEWPPDRRTPHRRVVYLESDYSDYEIMMIQTTAQEAPKVERALVVSLEPRDNTDRFEEYLGKFINDISQGKQPEPVESKDEEEDLPF